jgi:hypothetical protein
MATFSFPDAHTSTEYLRARNVAVRAFTEAITSRRRARGESAAPRIHVECSEFVRTEDGGVHTIYRVWARRGTEEATVRDFGAYAAEVDVENEHLAAYMPASGRAYAKVLSLTT